MYDFSHFELMPATEGVFANFANGVKKIIETFAKWLRTAISTLGSKLRRVPKRSAANSKNTARASANNPPPDAPKPVRTKDSDARRAINVIRTDTPALIIACNVVLHNLVSKCQNLSHQPSVFKPYEVKISRIEPSRVELNTRPNFNVKPNHFDYPEIGSTFNDIFEEYAKIMRSYDNFSDRIKDALSELRSMESLSQEDLKYGYETLKEVYSANGKFGDTWSDIKSVYEFVDSNSKIKQILGKIVQMYNFGIKTTKYFGSKLMADVDKEVVSAEANAEDMDYLRKLRGSHESATIISKLYDIAYEDAMNDLKMQSDYIKMYESVPDAFEHI